MDQKTYKTILQRLQQHNPQPTTELIYHSPFQLLIATMLSAHTTDVSVNKATRQLFKKAKTPASMLRLGEKTLKDYIKTVGLYNTKTKNIIKTCQLLLDRHQGKVPSTREDLEALPGVGRKTANIILNTLFNHLTIAVDTHVFRVANRLGLAHGKTPLTVEKQLLQNTSHAYLKDLHHWLVLHGRYICKAVRPNCPKCFLNDLCEYPHKTLPTDKS